MSWMLVLQVIIGIAVLVLGSLTGLRKLLCLCIAVIAGFFAFQSVRLFHDRLTFWFESYTTHQNAYVLSLIILAIPPLLIIYTLGRRLMVRLSITEGISSELDAILGGAYAGTLYLIVFQLVWGR